ncbi:quinone-dependent dihydroorotate dehydrogenase [Halioxenophilus sp. WMMB6]|uniref:quinone-dependent dihydroorotate dehydrogenase n=1 Tax=Halioxenophilus sp. WMMB6 TaxID=3073815 RepID=UPI00295EE604|nr:quinone-dependent dihydroorotate dehydrogenase [Halioxenophilus sp. WMMB6]
MYQLIRNLLFRLDPELSHEFSLDWIGALYRLGILPVVAPKVVDNPVEVMGLSFANPVGLAAGLDKNADYYNALGCLGFGFVEVGTVTPLAQPGNDQPRLFRLPEKQAIINRMGFNNLGVEHLVERVKQRKYTGVLGINIGKNKVTPEESALDDYLIALRAVFPYADYVTVNISSPNTPGLRNLQFGETLSNLLRGIHEQRLALSEEHQRQVPIAVKIAPDMSEEEIKQVAETIAEQKMDAIIATNTTLDKSSVEQLEFGSEAGGLSGLPVRDKSTQVIKTINAVLGDALPIIGVGGIFSADDALEKLEAGASLVQIYTGFIYQGPGLIAEINRALQNR